MTELRGYRVRGHVQGVGFRWWTRATAVELGLGGHVRNLPDGSVEIHAAGDEKDLDTLEESLWRGPSAARVDDVERLEPDPDTPRDAFHIQAW